MLAVLLVAELSLCVLAFVFSSAVKRKVVEVLQMQAIVHYRDDDDLRNLVDWTQNTVSIAQDSTSRHLHCESKKLCHFYFYCNFGKCWSIFKILSMSESERNGS